MIAFIELVATNYPLVFRHTGIMKLMCLHGYGTSGAIFQRQLSPIIEALGRNHQWIFVDGEVDVGASDLAEYHTGPYHAYHEGIEPTAVQTAHDLIDAVLDEEGPFDGVVAFSQGASLAISYILQHKRQHPREPSPFGFAVLFSPGFVLSPDLDYKRHILKPLVNHMTFERFQALLSKPLNCQQKLTMAEVYKMQHLDEREKNAVYEVLQTAVSVLGTRRSLGFENDEVFFKTTANGMIDEEAFPRFFHPVYTTELISIPTVHVVGRQEPPSLRRLATVARDFCEKSCMTVFEHGDGHRPPRNPGDVMAVVSAIEQANMFSQMQRTMSTIKARRQMACL
ncbi:Hypothetical protein R9X50_00536100 [Acrodontium crateriforme]|uniref:Serine hydrolase domain-containing protein n=1 Tax=Acrodontium crateriforme TaxID=150365 RepID=A0AAQ3R5V3_9PEZI|nr:Hypothetical protein R9X50_00536100 [Acrodontium crateriforme]